MNELQELMPKPDADDDRLVELHVRIAQRADQLAQGHAAPPSREADLQCWLEAEREILGENPEELTSVG